MSLRNSFQRQKLIRAWYTYLSNVFFVRLLCLILACVALMHFENGVVVCYMDFSLSFWLL